MTPDPAEVVFDQQWAVRLTNMDTQLERIANTAYWLGRQLAQHKITKADVDRRIAALCTQRGIDDPAWVPVDIAETTALDGLYRGMVS